MCAQLSLAGRQAMGTGAAISTPPTAHRGWVPAQGRRSPVDVLAEQETAEFVAAVKSGTLTAVQGV